MMIVKVTNMNKIMIFMTSFFACLTVKNLKITKDNHAVAFIKDSVSIVIYNYKPSVQLGFSTRTKNFWHRYFILPLATSW